jgi:hypothetical protein
MYRKKCFPNKLADGEKGKKGRNMSEKCAVVESENGKSYAMKCARKLALKYEQWLDVLRVISFSTAFFSLKENERKCLINRAPSWHLPASNSTITPAGGMFWQFKCKLS